MRHAPHAASAQARHQRGAIGGVGHPVVAEAAGVAQDRLEGVHAFLVEHPGNLRERRIDGEADAHRDHCTAFESDAGYAERPRRATTFPASRYMITYTIVR